MTAQPVPLHGDQRDALVFLRAAFGGKPDTWYVVAFELAGRSAHSFTDIEQLAAWAEGKAEIYVHVGLVQHAYSGHQRPKAPEIDGLIGFWADLDIEDPVHKKKGLPPDIDAALKIARLTGLEPSLVVHSGHGLQAWWLLNEPWLFDEFAERIRASRMARAWDISLRKRAERQLGYTVDAVGDVSRILRLPGTLNTKSAPVTVRVLASSAVRYGLDDIEAAFLDEGWTQAEREIGGGNGKSAPTGDLQLNAGAEPPFEKMFALLENEERFLATWNRTRRDAKSWSASEYDLALARFAAMAGWDRQEIASLLIAGRRKHGDDLKLRQDYYGPTIAKAMADQTERELLNEAVSLAEEAAKQAPDGEDFDRAGLLASISRGIGVEIRRVVRSRSEPPVFWLHTDAGAGELGRVEVLLSNNRFRARVAEITAVVPRRMKNEQWDPIAQALVRAAEIDELGIETTIAGQAETLVSLYLGDLLPVTLAEMDATSVELLPLTMRPFTGADGALRIFASGFKKWLATTQNTVLTANEVASMLKAYGARAETMHVRISGRRSTRSLWVLPDASGEGDVDKQTTSRAEKR